MKLSLLSSCQSSYRLSNKAIHSMRRQMSNAEWARECQVVSELLGIPPEQHQGMHCSEYVAKSITKPHDGLLGDRLIYWVITNFHPHERTAVGTLMAAIYLTPSDPEAYQHPQVLLLQGYDASYVAWLELYGDEEGKIVTMTEDKFPAWARKAEILLNRWRAGIMTSITTIADQ